MVKRIQQNPNFGRVQEFNVEHELPDSKARQAFRDDGVVCLRNAYNLEWLSLVEEGIKWSITGGSEHIEFNKMREESGLFILASNAWPRVAAFRRAIFDSRAPDLAFALLDSDSMNLYFDFTLIKEPNTFTAETPWHQDHAFLPLHGTGVVNCWTALDPIPMETALRFWAGSHREACLYQMNHVNDEGSDYNQEMNLGRGDRPTIPNIDSDASASILAAELAPGDMLVWDSYTFHKAPGNSLDRRRAALSTLWASDGVRFRDIPSLPHLRSPEITEGLPITCDKFPVMRTKASLQ